MKKLLVTLLAATCASTAANAATVVGVDENNNIVTFDSATPGTFATRAAVTGTTATFLALDYRDSNGLLYGIADDLRVYTLDAFTGAATAVTGVLDIQGSNFGFDFNTVVDAIRVVNNLDDNYVVNVEAGTATQFTDVAYGAGDENFGRDALVTGNAYIHGTPNQFAIGTNTDSLVRQANNDGTLTTVGSLGIAVGPRTSFDIDFDGTGYIADVNRFYTVDLETGAATFVGNTEDAVFGIAIAPNNVMNAVPEPGTWMLMLLGLGSVGFMMRRRNGMTTKVSYS